MPAHLAETSCPVIYFGILRDHDFDENRRTGKFQADRVQNRRWDSYTYVTSFSLCEELGEIRIFEHRKFDFVIGQLVVNCVAMRHWFVGMVHCVVRLGLGVFILIGSTPN